LKIGAALEIGKTDIIAPLYLIEKQKLNCSKQIHWISKEVAWKWLIALVGKSRT